MNCHAVLVSLALVAYPQEHIGVGRLLVELESTGNDIVVLALAKTSSGVTHVVWSENRPLSERNGGLGAWYGEYSPTGVRTRSILLGPHYTGNFSSHLLLTESGEVFVKRETGPGTELLIISPSGTVTKPPEARGGGGYSSVFWGLTGQGRVWWFNGSHSFGIWLFSTAGSLVRTARGEDVAWGRRSHYYYDNGTLLSVQCLPCNFTATLLPGAVDSVHFWTLGPSLKGREADYWLRVSADAEALPSVPGLKGTHIVPAGSDALVYVPAPTVDDTARYAVFRLDENGRHSKPGQRLESYTVSREEYEASPFPLYSLDSPVDGGAPGGLAGFSPSGRVYVETIAKWK